MAASSPRPRPQFVRVRAQSKFATSPQTCPLLLRELTETVICPWPCPVRVHARSESLVSPSPVRSRDQSESVLHPRQIQNVHGNCHRLSALSPCRRLTGINKAVRWPQKSANRHCNGHKMSLSTMRPCLSRLSPRSWIGQAALVQIAHDSKCDDACIEFQPLINQSV